MTLDLSNKSSLRAYGYLIRSAIEGRLEDFVCTDELLRAWEIIDPILDMGEETLVKYPLGSDGPTLADTLVADLPSGWLPLAGGA